MTQLTAAFGSEPVKLGLAVVLRESPCRFQQALVLEPPEGRIERALFDQQSIVALAADETGDGITVKRSPDQSLEYENIQSATKRCLDVRKTL
jgi:hypothetical protein